MIVWWSFNLQNMFSNLGAYLDLFHDYILGFLVFILFTVVGILCFILINKFSLKGFYEAPMLEIIWTLYPIIILIMIGIPRMRILYLHEVEETPDFRVKVTGHQWYWSYDYSDFENINFDRFIKPVGDLKSGEYRLLEVDNRVILPINSNIRFIIRSGDVLHSWTIPSFGIKADANPGRLNLVHIICPQAGIFFGQCSEICGANHRFIPISIEIVNFLLFKNWVLNQ